MKSHFAIDNDLLDSRIEVRSVKINKRVAIPQQICFRLDAETIEAIEQMKASQRQFRLSPPNLTTLRCYALFNLPLSKRGNHRSYLSQSAIIFSTQYLEDEFNSDILLRSTIDPQGKISQQIKQELVKHPILLERVLEAHYWLTNEVLSQLPLKPKNNYSRLIYGGIAIATFIVCSLTWYFLAQGLLIKLIICLLLIGIELTAIAIFRQLRWWAIYRLAENIFARKAFKRKFALLILNFLI